MSFQDSIVGQLLARSDEHKKVAAENKALEVLLRNSMPQVGMSPEQTDAILAPSADETPAARNAKLKAGLTGVLTQQQMAEQKQRMAEQQQHIALYQQQIQAAQRAEQDSQKNEAALRAAVAPVSAPQLPPAADVGAAFNRGAPIPQATTTQRDPTGDEMMRTYLAKGGNPTNADARLFIAAARPPKQEASLQQITLNDEDGNPVSFAWDGRSAPQRISNKPAKPTTQTIEVGGKKLTVGPGNKYFDENGQPVDFGEEKPMTATDWIISGQKPEDYKTYRENFAKATGRAPAAAAPAATTAPKFGPQFEGKKVKGPDGKIYQIKNGTPVPL